MKSVKNLRAIARSAPKNLGKRFTESARGATLNLARANMNRSESRSDNKNDSGSILDEQAPSGDDLQWLFD